MTQTQDKTARVKLAEVLAFHFKERHFTSHYISTKCRTTPANVEGWASGAILPDGNEWEQLHRKVSHDFARYTDLWRAARTEAQRERDIATRALSRPLGPKLVAAGVVPAPTPAAVPDPAPEPDPPRAAGPLSPGRYARAHIDIGIEPPTGLASDGRALSPPRPPGSMSREQVATREEYVRSILQQRPHARSGGPDGIVALVRQTFKVGIDPSTVERIRSELERERLETEVRAKIAAEAKTSAAAPAAPIGEPMPLPPPSSPPTFMPPPTFSPPPIPAPAQTLPWSPDEQALGEAVGLILGEIPELRSMTITVSDTGEASYTYEVRTVRTGGGTVRR